MAAGCLAISRSPGEGLRSLRQPYRRNKKGSYVYRLIWPAHLDDYPISNPISREKRIAGRFPPPPPLAGPWMPVVSWGGCVGGRHPASQSVALSVSQSWQATAGWLCPEKQPGRGLKQLAGVRASCRRLCWPRTRHPCVASLPSLMCYFK